MDAVELDLSALHDRIDQAAAEQAEAASQQRRSYTLIRPFGEAAGSYIQQIQDQDRFFLGLEGVDRLTRGHGRGELCYVTGRPHSGKTQIVLNALNNNSAKPILMFTPDESPELVLSKLIAVRHGVSSEALEERVLLGDPDAISLIEHAAATEFNKLIVLDAGLTLREMGRALDEAEHYWQEKCGCCIYDYLELLPGEGDFAGVGNKSRAMKQWTSESDAAMLCMHQGKRGDNQRGEAQGMDSMKFGGESEAIVVLEVYRKRDKKSLTPAEREGHKNSVTVNVAKNKRPPMRLGEVTFYMNPDTGHVRPMTTQDMIRDGKPSDNPADILSARRTIQ